MSPRVFVYGTLLRGEGNHGLLASARFIGAAKTRPEFSFHDLGGCPGLIADLPPPLSQQAVTGEVYEVTVFTLRTLDRLEGHPTFYQRKPIELASGALVMTYILPLQFANRPVIISGCWRTHKKAQNADHNVRRPSL